MRRKLWVLLGTGALAVPLIVVATAFACGSLATLKLNRATATPGAQVGAVGGNYNTSPQASPVQLRFNGRSGPVLWEGRPTRTGRIAAAFAFPKVRAGAYVILATQTGPDGRPAAGTPGRAPLRGRVARRSSSSEVVVWPGAREGGPPAQQGLPVSTPVLAGVAVLALGIVGGAVALLPPSRRRALRPARTAS